MAADELLALGPASQQLIDLRGRAVIDGHRVAAAFDVESQILAHDGETNETEISGGGHGAGFRVRGSGFSTKSPQADGTLLQAIRATRFLFLGLRPGRGRGPGSGALVWSGLLSLGLDRLGSLTFR